MSGGETFAPAGIDSFQDEHDEHQVAGELNDPAREVIPAAKGEAEPEKDQAREPERREAGCAEGPSDLHASIVSPETERNSKDGGKNRGRSPPKPIRPRVGCARTE